MVVKSISKQILYEFIEELSKNKSIEEHRLKSLKKLLGSEKFKKEDIVKVLKEEENEEENNEDS